MIPKDGVNWKLGGVVDSVPPDEGCDVVDREVSVVARDKSDNKNVADNDDAQKVIKWRVIIMCYRG